MNTCLVWLQTLGHKEQETYSKLNPSTGKAQGTFPKSNKDTVTGAIAHARRTFKKWKQGFPPSTKT